MIRKPLVASAVVLAALGVGIVATAQRQAPLKLRFVTPVWQTQAVAAAKKIVADWNSRYPNVQVEMQQVDWGSIQAYLTTSFESRNVPDLFHYDSVRLLEFAKRGNLADLSKLISADMRKDIAPIAWASAEDSSGAVFGVPFLWESLVTLYNKDLFKAAGVKVPTGKNTWSWEDFRKVAKTLTRDKNGDGTTDQWGTTFNLRNPTQRILDTSLGFGGEYFYREGNRWVLKVGPNERALLKLATDMLYVDKVASPDGLGLPTADLFTGFFAGKYATLSFVGVYARQQIAEGGPKNFNWGMLPPFKGTKSADQGAVTQTISIPAASTHKKEAMDFLNFYLNRLNVAELAAGDWELPARISSTRAAVFQTEANGWKTAVGSIQNLRLAPWQKITGFAELDTRVMRPIFQQLLANRISIDEAARRIEQEGNQLLSRQ